MAKNASSFDLDTNTLALNKSVSNIVSVRDAVLWVKINVPADNSDSTLCAVSHADVVADTSTALFPQNATIIAGVDAVLKNEGVGPVCGGNLTITAEGAATAYNKGNNPTISGNAVIQTSGQVILSGKGTVCAGSLTVAAGGMVSVEADNCDSPCPILGGNVSITTSQYVEIYGYSTGELIAGDVELSVGSDISSGLQNNDQDGYVMGGTLTYPAQKEAKAYTDVNATTGGTKIPSRTTPSGATGYTAFRMIELKNPEPKVIHHEDPEYTLRFKTNGGRLASVRGYRTTGGYVFEKDGFIFTGWFTDSALTEAVSMVKLTKNMIVYVRWRGKPPAPFTDVDAGG